MLGNRDDRGKPEVWCAGSSDCIGGRAVRVARVDMACLYALEAVETIDSAAEGVLHPLAQKTLS